MSDKPIIIAGLAVFLIAATFPVWYTLGSGGDASPPELELPEGQCVKDAEWMRANHMNLLREWREAVVRRGDKSQIEINGKKYAKSLTKGCMNCHTSREKFCARCHEYANVLALRPWQESATAQRTQQGVHCWNCHVELKGD